MVGGLLGNGYRVVYVTVMGRVVYVTVMGRVVLCDGDG